MVGKFERRGFLKLGVASAAGLACGTVSAHEYFTVNFTLVHPWTRASAPGATFAIIGMKFEDVTTADRMIGATSPLADGAEMGGPGGPAPLAIEIPAGRTTELTEAGVHLRLVRLKRPLELGRELPITLVFEKAGSLRATFLVDYPAA
jgi:copper(I)-binding protein